MFIAFSARKMAGSKIVHNNFRGFCLPNSSESKFDADYFDCIYL